MRRPLAETHLVEDPVLHELRQGAEVAERRGVLIGFTAVGPWPVPDLEVRRALLDGPLAVLATASTRARAPVIGAGGSLSINVVADGPGWTVSRVHDQVENTVFAAGGSTCSGSCGASPADLAERA